MAFKVIFGFPADFGSTFQSFTVKCFSVMYWKIGRLEEYVVYCLELNPLGLNYSLPEKTGSFSRAQDRTATINQFTDFTTTLISLESEMC
jgi:hypothetical protein